MTEFAASCARWDPVVQVIIRRVFPFALLLLLLDWFVLGCLWFAVPIFLDLFRISLSSSFEEVLL